MANASLLNLDTIAQLADDMGISIGEILPDLVDSLENDANRSFAEMQEALSSKDGERLKRAAHKLKGSCGTLGAEKAAAIAQELESDARAGSIDYVLPLVERLEAVCRQSIDEMRNLRL